MKLKNSKPKVIGNPYKYLENAKAILEEKAKREGEFYKYRKYVKMAGHTAWTGVLLALDYLMEKQNIRIKGRRNVNKYSEFISKRDKKILNYFNSAYDILHIYMGYDGNLSVKLAKTGLEYAKVIIDWVAKQVEFIEE
ncbi:MAG: DUF5618 family protein [candidate division WOR-3 bacterium]